VIKKVKKRKRINVELVGEGNEGKTVLLQSLINELERGNKHNLFVALLTSAILEFSLLSISC
jgi:transcriptional regulator of acetoin/glycerol metabolism